MKTILCSLFFPISCATAADLWFSGGQEIEVTGEFLSADDIDVQSYRTSYSGSDGPWTIEAGIGHTRYQETYQPVLFGTNEKLNEETWQGDLSITREWSDEWSGTLTLSAYEGFADYRSIWISEYYRQLFGAFPAYEEADPKGRSIGAEATWNYLPGSGSANISLNYGRDQIAPGWSFNPAAGVPEAGAEWLNTVSVGATAEQAITPWLKTELALTGRHTTDRKTRVGIRNSWAATAGPVAFRLSGGYSEEPPSFDASYASAVIEWNFLPQWSAHIGYRAYQDSGEIQTSGFDALAPPVDSTELFGGILWDRGDLAVSAGVGLLSTDYEALSEDNEFFGNLYRDRDWLTFRFGISYQF